MYPRFLGCCQTKKKELEMGSEKVMNESDTSVGRFPSFREDGNLWR
jgi:hypothetical protein